MHLSLETTFDLIEERMEAENREFWNDHIGGCPDCRKQLDDWQNLHRSLKRRHLEDAPESAIRSASSLFPERKTKTAHALRTVLATLMFDSFAQPALAGARGAAEARQVVLRAEEFDIHIKILGGPDRKELLGQLLPRGTAGFVQTARLHLLRNGERFESTAADDMGEFHFAEVPDGLLSLQVDLPHLTVIGSLNVTNFL